MTPIITNFSGYVHPCGAISVGLIPRNKNKTAEERRNQISHNKIERRRLNAPNGTELVDGLARQLKDGQITVSQAVEAIHSIGLSSLQNSRNSLISSNYQAEINPTDVQSSGLHKPINRYGANGITSQGRLRVRDGATILEQKYGRRSLTFATITLPAMPDETLNQVCENWGEYVHRVVEEIKRELLRRNAPLEIIYCTEIQEKRYLRYGQIAPHLHLLWYSYERDINGMATGRYAINATWLRELNQRIIYRITGNQDIATGASVDTQKIKKSAANYLGKYMSKGGKIVDKIKQDGKAGLLPRAWWGVTKELREQIIRAIIKVGDNIAKNLFYCTDKLEKMGVLSRYGKVAVNRRYYDCNQNAEVNADVVYGIYGQLSPKLQGQNDLLVSILDICDRVDDDCIDDICSLVSAMNNADMVQDVTDFMVALKQLIIENNEINVIVDIDTGEVSALDFNVV
ncbi:MAG: hypothetical protein ACK6A9_21345 [Dolichospermum sp.]|jgi:hypothetical protein